MTHENLSRGQVNNKPSYTRYRGGNAKKSNVHSPYPTPRIDYAAIRQAKLKCGDCANLRLGTCSKDALECKDWRPGGDDNGFAWDRVGAVVEGGFGGGFGARL